jgi:hypothetical protein
MTRNALIVEEEKMKLDEEWGKARRKPKERHD